MELNTLHSAEREADKKKGIYATLRLGSSKRKSSSQTSIGSPAAPPRETELHWTSNQLPKIPPEIGKLHWLKV